MTHFPNNYNQYNGMNSIPTNTYHGHQEPHVIIERHYVPTNIYNQMYRTQSNHTNHNTPNVLYDAYGTPYYNVSGYTPNYSNQPSQTASARNTQSNMSADTLNRIFDVIFPPSGSRSSRRSRNRTRTSTGQTTNTSNESNPTAAAAGQPSTSRASAATPFENLFNLGGGTGTEAGARNANTTGTRRGGIRTMTANSMEEFNDFVSSMMNGISNGTVQSGGYSVTFGSPGEMEDVPVGLTPQQINEFTELVNYDGEEELTCSVCRDNIEEGAHCRKINGCGHYFHHGCLDTWLTNHHTCPNCRADLRETGSENENENEPPTEPDNEDTIRETTVSGPTIV